MAGQSAVGCLVEEGAGCYTTCNQSSGNSTIFKWVRSLTLPQASPFKDRKVSHQLQEFNYNWVINMAYGDTHQSY